MPEYSSSVMIYRKKKSFSPFPFWGMGGLDDNMKQYKLLIFFFNSEMENVALVYFHSLSCSEAFGGRFFGGLS